MRLSAGMLLHIYLVHLVPRANSDHLDQVTVLTCPPLCVRERLRFSMNGPVINEHARHLIVVCVRVCVCVCVCGGGRTALCSAVLSLAVMRGGRRDREESRKGRRRRDSGGRAEQWGGQARRVPRVAVLDSCGRGRRATEKSSELAFTPKRILFIVSPQKCVLRVVSRRWATILHFVFSVGLVSRAPGSVRGCFAFCLLAFIQICRVASLISCWFLTHNASDLYFTAVVKMWWTPLWADFTSRSVKIRWKTKRGGDQP